MREKARQIHLGPSGINAGLPSCAVCRRQDETVRYVSYPFVFSIVVLTFRRSFSGWWCRKHGNLRWLLASLITTTFGWLGIPFGLIFTPIALIKLARGGDQPAEANASMLYRLAEHRLTGGDTEGAIRCLEASLRLHDDAVVARRLGELSQYRSSVEEGNRRQVLSVIAAIAGAGLLGIAVGILDFLASWGFSLLFGRETNLYVAVLSWTPLLGAAFVGGLILSRLVGWAVAQTRHPPLLLGIAIAVVSAALALYGVPTGRAMGMYVHMLLSGMALEPVLDALRTAGAVLTRGGVWWIVDTVVTGDTFTYIYMLLLSVCFLYYVSTSIAAAVSAVRWKQRIAVSRFPRSGLVTRALAPGWLALLVVGLGSAILFSLFPQQATVDYFEAIAHNTTAMELWEQGATDGALQELQQAVLLKPSFAIARSNLGWVHYHLGDLDQAAEEFQEAIRLAPGVASAHSGLGWVHYFREDPDRAAQEFQEAIRLEPDVADHHEGLGFCSLWQDDHDAAADAFGAALKLNPDSAAAHGGLGQVHYALDNLDEARRELELSIGLDPQDPGVRMVLGLTYMGCARFEKAIEQLLAASELQPEWVVPHASLAWIYYQLDRLDEMEYEIDQTLALQDGDPYAHTMLARVYYELRQFGQAEAQFVKAIGLTPEAWIYTSLAQTYSAQRRFDLALEMCDKASELDSDGVDILVARADIYTEQEDLDQALAHLEHALELAPEDSDVHSYLSYVYYHRGQIPDALREAQEVMRLQPYNASGYKNAAFAYYALGEIDLALAAAEQAVQLRPKYDTAHYVRGLCHLDHGENEEAAAAFSTFLDLYWDRAYVREYRMKAGAYLAQLK